jgi:hypothetical protein
MESSTSSPSGEIRWRGGRPQRPHDWRVGRGDRVSRGVNLSTLIAHKVMSLSRKIAIRPGPTRPRAVIATPRVAASPAQRAKVAGIGCLVCGRTPADPAHLVARRFGGCDSPDCVVPLCRTHHRLFDCARLALKPYLWSGHEREVGHALSHVGQGDLDAALRRGWPAPWAGGISNTNDGGRR